MARGARRSRAKVDVEAKALAAGRDAKAQSYYVALSGGG